MLARDEASLKRTPLHALHAARGGKMVPFAGYEMPVQYPAGVLREHLHTRANAGLFDVSHMGQLALRPKSGQVADAALALERLVPQDIVAVAPGRQRYAQFTNPEGGILDDLMVANFGDHLFLVVNAACKAEDEAHLRANLSGACIIDALSDRALIALQGPKAESALAKFCADVTAMRFMDTGPRKVAGFDCFVSRSGYTGEDGFEISVPAAQAEALVTALHARHWALTTPGMAFERLAHTEEMLRVALDSFSRRDLAGAESLVELDELIDRANRRFVERLVDVMAEEEFRDSVRHWIAENHPGREPSSDEESFAFRRDWQRKLNDRGWAGLTAARFSSPRSGAFSMPSGSTANPWRAIFSP